MKPPKPEMGPYLDSLDSAERAMKEWMDRKVLRGSDLADDVFKAPEDCPLWNLGLSLAQAGSVWAAAKRGKYD